MAEQGSDKQTLDRAQALRAALAPAEAKLWNIVRNRKLGFKFRRQQPLGPFIVDFFCAEARLIVEIDGDSHAERSDYDARRTDWLEARGYRVVRYLNGDVHPRPDEVRRGIAMALDAALPHPGREDATGPSPLRGEGR